MNIRSYHLFTLTLLLSLCLAPANICGQSILPGVVTAKQTADLTPGTTQNLVEIFVEEGETVKQGQILAKLDARMAEAEYKAAKVVAEGGANVQLAEIELTEAQTKAQRMQIALTRNAGTQLEVEVAQNAVRKAEANLQLAKDLLEQAWQTAETAKQRLELYYIRAPFDGQITRVNVRIGNRVDPTQTVMQIISSSELMAELHLPLQLYGRFQVGDTHQLTGGMPVENPVTARLTHVSSVVDTATQTFRVRFEIDNSDAKLPVGFPVTLKEQDLAQTRSASHKN